MARAQRRRPGAAAGAEPPPAAPAGRATARFALTILRRGAGLAESALSRRPRTAAALFAAPPP